MDEPLASLDAPRKAEILPFLARLKTALKLPILYVTHSTEELASLADTLVLLDVGHVIAAGPLEEIITRSDLPLATRDDSGSVLTANVLEHDKKRQLTALRTGSIRLWVSLLDRELGTQVRVRVPAREVILAASDLGPTSAHNVIVGPVRAIAQDENKNTALVEVELGGNATLLARVTRDAIERVGLAVGRDAAALVKSMSVEILPG
jgi:molybdate transport system ATP-binding protein